MCPLNVLTFSVFQSWADFIGSVPTCCLGTLCSHYIWMTFELKLKVILGLKRIPPTHQTHPRACHSLNGSTVPTDNVAEREVGCQVNSVYQNVRGGGEQWVMKEDRELRWQLADGGRDRGLEVMCEGEMRNVSGCNKLNPDRPNKTQQSMAETPAEPQVKPAEGLLII